MDPFAGLKVLDAGSFIAAPIAATLLGDMGADVIKIEAPGKGDGYRETYRVPNLPVCEHNYSWSLVGRSKRSLALDLTQPAGQAILHKLVAEADVLITNYPPSRRRRLGLDFAALAELNPRLVYASLTGYGETGPEADVPGFDAAAYWARSGMADQMRPGPESPPATCVSGMGDMPTGVSLYAAIVTALYRRLHTGQGGVVSTSLLANGAWANGVALQATLCGGEVPYRKPRHQAINPLANYYLCRDGRWLLLNLIHSDRDWPAFTAAAGLAALRDDPRFACAAQRRTEAGALIALLEHTFAQDDSAVWHTRLGAAGLTVGVVARTADLPEDAQLRQAGGLIPTHLVPGATATPAPPFLIDGQATAPTRGAPGLGEHTDAILQEYGVSGEQRAALRRSGVIG